jgi:hypothetical protein
VYRKLITIALARTRIPERINIVAETRALASANPKFVNLTPFPTRLLNEAAEAVYLMRPVVEALASPPNKVRMPASNEIA